METNGYRLLLPEGTLDYFTMNIRCKGKQYGNSNLS